MLKLVRGDFPLLPSEQRCTVVESARLASEEHNLLIASLQCLINIAERFGSGLNRLTSTHQWHSPTRGQLLGLCDNTTEHTCDRLQELRTIRPGREPPPRRFFGSRPGAVVFKYRTDLESIQREMGRPDYHARRVYVPSSAGIDRSHVEPILAPVPRLPPTSYRYYNAHTGSSPDSGYSTVSGSPVVGPFNVNEHVVDDATELSSIESCDSSRRSDSRRRSSRLEPQVRREQSRPPETGAQVLKRRRRRRCRYSQPQPSARRCFVM